MAIKIASPTQQGVQVGGLPYSLAVTAIADSNINTVFSGVLRDS
jgi:hypothetical protein